MIVMTRTVSICVPANLLPVLAAFLENAPDMRDAMNAGTLMLSTDVDAEADILVVPSLESALQWGRDHNPNWRFAVAQASAFLQPIGESAARDNVTIIHERDLEVRPNFVLQTIAELMGFSRGDEIENSHIPKPPSLANSEDMPDEVSPLRIYREIPVLSGAWAHWPPSLFSTFDGPCPSSIDIMGRARLLFFGPYMVLMPGKWQVDLVFELTEEALPYDYFIDIGATDKFRRVPFRPKTAGRHIINLKHIAHDRGHMEIKFGIHRSAFHGELKLEGVWIKRAD